MLVTSSSSLATYCLPPDLLTPILYPLPPATHGFLLGFLCPPKLAWPSEPSTRPLGQATHTALSGQSREQTTLEGMSGVSHLEGLLGRPVWESFRMALLRGALFWMPFLGKNHLGRHHRTPLKGGAKPACYCCIRALSPTMYSRRGSECPWAWSGRSEHSNLHRIHECRPPPPPHALAPLVWNQSLPLGCYPVLFPTRPR